MWCYSIGHSASTNCSNATIVIVSGRQRKNQNIKRMTFVCIIAIASGFKSWEARQVDTHIYIEGQRKIFTSNNFFTLFYHFLGEFKTEEKVEPHIIGTEDDLYTYKKRKKGKKKKKKKIPSLPINSSKIRWIVWQCTSRS